MSLKKMMLFFLATITLQTPEILNAGEDTAYLDSSGFLPIEQDSDLSFLLTTAESGESSLPQADGLPAATLFDPQDLLADIIRMTEDGSIWELSTEEDDSLSDLSTEDGQTIPAQPFYPPLTDLQATDSEPTTAQFSSPTTKKRTNFYTKRITDQPGFFPCQYCDVIYTKLSSRGQHEMRKHLGDPGYLCTFCEKQISHLGNKPRHLRVCPKNPAVKAK